jgi:hypothetical protein
MQVIIGEKLILWVIGIRRDGSFSTATAFGPVLSIRLPDKRLV